MDAPFCILQNVLSRGRFQRCFLAAPAVKKHPAARSGTRTQTFKNVSLPCISNAFLPGIVDGVGHSKRQIMRCQRQIELTSAILSEAMHSTAHDRLGHRAMRDFLTEKQTFQGIANSCFRSFRNGEKKTIFKRIREAFPLHGSIDLQLSPFSLLVYTFS